MRVILISGNHPRHSYYANSIAEEIDLAAHIQTKREEMLPPAPEDLNNHLKELWELHFYKRSESELNFFGDSTELKFKCPTLVISAGQLNSDETIEWYLKQEKFDLALIAGTEIIKDPLFGLLPEYKLNFHMGLLPWYRGSITGFWPFHDLRPNWLGVSYHNIERRVDTGEILHQVPLKLVKTDCLHDACCRVYVDACNDVWKVLKHVRIVLEDGVMPLPDPGRAQKGRLYMKRDWHAGLLVSNYDTFEDRMIEALMDGEIPCVPLPKLYQINSAGIGEKG